MLNNKLVNKVGWMLAGSSLSLLLSGSVHAGEVRKAATEDNSIVVAQLASDALNKNKQLTPEEALQRGLKIAAKAKAPKDHILAFEYLNFAAKQGLAEAQFQCAIMHLDNQFAPSDDDRAIKLLEKARDQGHKQAEVALNFIRYAEDGIGC